MNNYALPVCGFATAALNRSHQFPSANHGNFFGTDMMSSGSFGLRSYQFEYRFQGLRLWNYRLQAPEIELFHHLFVRLARKEDSVRMGKRGKPSPIAGISQAFVDQNHSDSETHGFR